MSPFTRADTDQIALGGVAGWVMAVAHLGDPEKQPSQEMVEGLVKQAQTVAWIYRHHLSRHVVLVGFCGTIAAASVPHITYWAKQRRERGKAAREDAWARKEAEETKRQAEAKEQSIVAQAPGPVS